jgi:hypothetical protein
VVGQLKKAEVVEVVKQISQDKPGGPGYLANYQPGLKVVVAGLSDNELAEMASIAEQWNREGASEQVKQRNAESHGSRYFKHVAEEAYKKFGMRIFVLEAHKDTSGALFYGRCVQ